MSTGATGKKPSGVTNGGPPASRTVSRIDVGMPACSAASRVLSGPSFIWSIRSTNAVLTDFWVANSSGTLPNDCTTAVALVLGDDLAVDDSGDEPLSLVLRL